MSKRKRVIVVSAVLVSFLLIILFAFYNILHVRHWQYAYYGKSVDGNIECEMLLTTPTYKNLQYYLYFRKSLKSGSFLGEVWIKTNKNHGTYVYTCKNTEEFAINVNRFFVNCGEWEKSGNIYATRNFLKQSRKFDLPLNVSFSAPFSRKNIVVIRMEKMPVSLLPYVPSCNATDLMKSVPH